MHCPQPTLVNLNNPTEKKVLQVIVRWDPVTRAAAVTRDIVDTAGHLDVRSYPRGPARPDNVAYYLHNFVSTRWRRRKSIVRYVSRYIETVEV